MDLKESTTCAHYESEFIAREVLEETIINKLADFMLPKILIAKSSLIDSFHVQASITDVTMTDFHCKPEQLNENFDNRPQPMVLKVKKEHKANQPSTEQKQNKSKSYLWQRASKNYQKLGKRVQIKKQVPRYPVKLKGDRERRTHKDRREVSFLSYNNNINDFFEFFSGGTDDALERVLREKKLENEMSSKQKYTQSLFEKKSEAKKAKQAQGKKGILPFNTDYNGNALTYSKKYSVHNPPNYIDVNFTVLDEEEVHNNGRKTQSEVQLEEKALKTKKFEKLNFIEETNCFSTRFLRKFSMLEKPVSREKIWESEQKSRVPSSNLLKQTIKYIPKQVSFSTLNKLKNSQKQPIEQKQKQKPSKPIEKKTKVIPFQPRISKLPPSISSTFTNEKSTGETKAKTGEKNKTNIVLGNQSALNFLLTQGYTMRKNVTFTDFVGSP